LPSGRHRPLAWGLMAKKSPRHRVTKTVMPMIVRKD
jgi:hypothetical protein